MGKKHNATAVTNGAGRGRLAWAWSLLAVATAICVSVGACALLLPDRAPALLGSAGETTTAPASVQEYSGSQQVTVCPPSPPNAIFSATPTAPSPPTGPQTDSPPAKAHTRSTTA